jgi:hypothetical protein
MADFKIHLPGILNPETSENDLVRTLRKKVCEGVTRTVGKKISDLIQLNVKPFDAELRIGGLNNNLNLRQLKVKPFDAEVRIGGLDFNRNLRRVRTTSVNTNLNIGGLNLNAELDFNR